MISQLTGTVVDKLLSTTIIDVGGVGYEVACTMRCSEGLAIGEQAQVVIYTDVKEDSIRLYGFTDLLEKQIFLMLIAVKGVGAKSGLEILSHIDARSLLRVIGAGEVTQLHKVKGIGKKTAERIIVELKDKVGDYAGEIRPMAVHQQTANGEVFSNAGSDAVSALQALGFSEAEASNAVTEAFKDEAVGAMPVGDIVKEALRYV